MTNYQDNVFARPDTLLGICEAVGEDFRFNANWLRVAFALPMFWAPMVTIGVYLALGLVVMLTRLAVPNPLAAGADEAVAAAVPAPVAEEVEPEPEPELALAA